MRPDSAKTEMLQGLVDMLVLKTVAHQPLHGYGVAQQIKLISGDRIQIPQGSLYPALHRLENRDYLKSEWADTDTGRRAKVYRITPLGRRRLADELSGWRELSIAIGLVLGNV